MVITEAMDDMLHPHTVLGIAAHPDDLDFGAGGTMAHFAATGAAIYYLILTDGSSGSEDRHTVPAQLSAQRQAEQRDAASVIGVSDVFFLDYKDGQLENTLDLKRDIVRVIRQIRPGTIITWDPSCLYSAARGLINHPDHRASGQAALDALFPLARDHLAFPELYSDEGLEPHKTPTVLLMHFDNHNFAIDITNTLDTKLQAIDKHVSQLADPAQTRRMLTDVAERTGADYGYRYAEGFIRIDVA
jgi:LmbE family N-acetylglucosaminyl deacetylase